MKRTRNNTYDPIKIVVIGAGIRGKNLARQINKISSPCRIVGVAEPCLKRRTKFAKEFNLPESALFESWNDFFKSSIACEAVIIATLDNMHTEPALKSLKRGCHILIEKPLSDTLKGCLQIEKLQQETGLVVSVCHTLRYMEAFQKIKKITESGILGNLVHIEHMEAIDHIRFSHNYVRGRWAKEANNTFLLLHKSCHDIDFILWLTREKCTRVSSFGSCSFFKPENAPANSHMHCFDCALQDSCLYSAFNLYVDNDLTGRISDLGDTSSRQARLEAIKDGPFGVCVWKADNDVVDHQVVTMEFSKGMTATCTLSGFSATHGRRCRIQGTSGELFFDEVNNNISVKKFNYSEFENIPVSPSESYHPEDKEIVSGWIEAINSSNQENVAVNAHEALRTHKVVFAAEESRKKQSTIII